MVTIALLQNTINASGASRFVIDGFPRTIDQGLEFEEQVCPSRAVIYFECPEEAMLRLVLKRGESSGRLADNAEPVSTSVVDHYVRENKVITISCFGTPEEIHQEIKGTLGGAPRGMPFPRFRTWGAASAPLHRTHEPAPARTPAEEVWPPGKLHDEISVSRTAFPRAAFRRGYLVPPRPVPGGICTLCAEGAGGRKKQRFGAARTKSVIQ
ncbi:MAG: hypothetical protein BJ554DRAFT_3938 [Olpidium bornovanus]|uniref:Adenylate kinase n=1 Tax=Olpidium bornovanus TaxID=278681 RepID=A0A8H7ZNQ4_9FUNG|nr:MAG: hypothetical protein BJ554DRAFT_3938 [Olpidium bornovanus]